MLKTSTLTIEDFSESKVKAKTKSSSVKKQLMPADSSFKFETKASTSAAMIKDMELKMDLDSKVDFTISKVESVLQNIEFFKAILLQHKQVEPRCPECTKKMSEFWPICPYCEIGEHDTELGLKQSMLSISGDASFCPDCKRIIKPNWQVCPFCYVKNKK